MLRTRLMNRNRRIAYLVGFVAVLLWSVPLTRAIRLYRESWHYLSETRSSDAGRDVDFSLDLLHSYTYSLGAALVVVWCLFSRPRAVFAIPLCVALFAPCEVILLRPEEAIVLIPVMHPYRPAFISIFALLVALALRYLPRRAM
jgi:hypothetical protein